MNDQLKIRKGHELKEGEFTFGVSIDLPGEKLYRLTGVYPSPSLPDLQAVADRILDFFNGHLGTQFEATERIKEYGQET